MEFSWQLQALFDHFVVDIVVNAVVLLMIAQSKQARLQFCRLAAHRTIATSVRELLVDVHLSRMSTKEGNRFLKIFFGDPRVFAEGQTNTDLMLGGVDVKALMVNESVHGLDTETMLLASVLSVDIFAIGHVVV